MKKLFLLMSAAVVSNLFAAAAPATVKGKVNVTDFLNVRLGPGLRHPVTGRLLPGQEVEILKVAENWLELKAPETLKIYISEANVNPDGKLNRELNMRSRMDVTAPSYGILPAGTVVKRLDERRNGWVRIVPPETIKVYVTALCVNFDRNEFDANGIPRKKDVPAPAANAAVKKDAPTVTPNAAPAADAPAEKKEVPAEKKDIPAEKKDAAPAADTSLKTLSGVAYKWKYAKSSDTAIAFLDAPKGRNQAFIVGKTDEIQNKLMLLADSQKKFDVKGEYKSNTPVAVFIVSAIVEK